MSVYLKNSCDLNIYEIINGTDIKKIKSLLSQDPHVIQHLKTPNIELYAFAISIDPKVIMYYHNAPLELQKITFDMAIEHGIASTIIHFINNPAEEIQLKALKSNILSYYYIDFPTLNVENKFKQVMRYTD